MFGGNLHFARSPNFGNEYESSADIWFGGGRQCLERLVDLFCCANRSNALSSGSFCEIQGFAIGFMRYLLPLYPLFALFAALVVFRLISILKPQWLFFVLFICISGMLIWPLSFVTIYSKQNTRVLASNWISKNIPAGKTLGVEHWDDRLPLFGSENYKFVELTLYDQPDNEEKWETIHTK